MKAEPISFDPRSFRRTKPKDYVVRFCFGGTISVIAFLAGHWFGPVVGGLLLAFPALLPATLTLADEHEARNAAVVEARNAAVVEARNAALGALGLISFALTFRALAGRSAILAVGLAITAWFVSAAVLWFLAECLRNGRRG